MKKMVLRIAVAALLVPSASAVAMQERLRSAGSAAKARMQQMRESVAKNTKKLSEWTGSLMADVGRAIKKRDLDKIPAIIKRHKKKAAGIIGTAAVLAGIGLLVRTVRSAPSSMPTAQLALQESKASQQQRTTAAREAAVREAAVREAALWEAADRETKAQIEAALRLKKEAQAQGAREAAARATLGEGASEEAVRQGAELRRRLATIPVPPSFKKR